MYEISIDRMIEFKQCERDIVKLEHYINAKFANQINGESAVDTAIRLLNSLSD